MLKLVAIPVDKFSAAKTIIRFDYDLSAALYVDAFKNTLEKTMTSYLRFLTNKMVM